MIISVNNKPPIEAFRLLMKKTDGLLNHDASLRPDYYVKRGGNPLEDDVKDALDEAAAGTAFEGTIEKVSGQRFPDIVAAKFYGVEVKSTKEDHWRSTGSSILESTRIQDVERIYMTFGKLGGSPILFRSKPYEQCLYGIAVTHMPRYLIDMQLGEGDTIFEKMGVPYDELRKMDNPVAPVARYYRSKLKPGETLWWTGDTVDEVVAPTIRLWNTITPEEKRRYGTYGCAIYPEVFGGNYDRYALWLSTQGIIDHHIRDQFSAGGKEPMLLNSGEIVRFPGVFRRVKNNKKQFVHFLATQGEKPIVDGNELRDRILMWIDTVARYTSATPSSNVSYELCKEALAVMFFGVGTTFAR